MEASFWHGKRVLVTGHTGFKGSWLVTWLQRLGADVTGLALPPETTPNLFDLTAARCDIRSIIADLRDKEAIEAAVRTTNPHVILHLAAQALVRPSYDDPVNTFAVNVMGTVHLLDSARRADNLQAVVIVTSDKCYENREWAWPYRENDPLGGHDPYSASKGCAELATASMRRAFYNKAGAPGVATARAGNVIGGGDWGTDRLVPDIMRALAQATAPRIRNPSATRPWQHVLEPLSGYLTLAQHLCEAPDTVSEAWNFGPDPSHIITVGELVDAFVSRWPHAPDWTADSAPQPHEANLLAVDASKARLRLGWRPRLTIEDTLDLTAAWYAGHAAGQDALALTVSQIEDYERRIAEAPPPC